MWFLAKMNWQPLSLVRQSNEFKTITTRKQLGNKNCTQTSFVELWSSLEEAVLSVFSNNGLIDK